VKLGTTVKNEKYVIEMREGWGNCLEGRVVN